MTAPRPRRLAALVVGLALLGATASCSSDGPSGETARSAPARGGSVTYLFSGAALGSFDPAQTAQSTGAASYLDAVYGMLLFEDDHHGGAVVHSLASSLAPVAGDLTHWKLEVRPDVEFSDGTPFDAEAVKYNWERAKGLATSESGPAAAGITAMSVTSPRTLDIDLAEPSAVFDRTVASSLTFIGSPKAMKADPAGFLKKPVGAGPFLVRSLSADGTASYLRNPSYWDAPRPYLDRLTIKFVADDQQRVNTLVAGGADMANPGPGPQARKSGTDAGFRLVQAAVTGGGGLLMFNTARLPFSDRDARRAIELAVDRQGMSDTFTGGTGRVIPTMFAASSPYYSPAAAMPKRDAAKAQALFDAYAEEHGGPMQITLTVAQGAASLAELIQAQLAGYKNVQVKVGLVDNAQFFPSLKSGSFDLANFAWTASHPLASFEQFYETGGPFNLGSYSNPRVDDLLEQASKTTDRAEEIATYAKIQKILVVDDAVAFFTWQPTRFVLRSPKVRGLDYASDGIWLWDRVWKAGS